MYEIHKISKYNATLNILSAKISKISIIVLKCKCSKSVKTKLVQNPCLKMWFICSCSSFRIREAAEGKASNLQPAFEIFF